MDIKVKLEPTDTLSSEYEEELSYPENQQFEQLNIKSEIIEDYSDSEDDAPLAQTIKKEIVVEIKVENDVNFPEESEPPLPLKKQKLQKSKKSTKTSNKKITAKIDGVERVKKALTRKKEIKYENNPEAYYTNIVKKAERLLESEEITQHIEVVTLTEEERQIEHRAAFNARKHMKYLCEGCGLGFVVQRVYLTHMRTHAPEAGHLSCEMCGMRFKSEDTFSQHRWRHYRRYRCALCHLRIKCRASLACHVALEHKGHVFSCPDCHKVFRRPSCLKGHIEQFHAKTEVFECPICKRVMHGRKSFSCHVRSHNEEARHSKQLKATCDICVRDFKNKTALKKHMLTHQSAAKCELCGQTAKNPLALTIHMKKHRQKFRKQTPVPCPECGRTFTSPYMLKRHAERIHALEKHKRFECDYCGARFMSKGEVREHIMWSHLGAARAHACACGRVFRTPGRLRAHVASAHLKLQPPKNHACDVCQKAFPTNALMNRHKRSHTEQRYPCEECGESFKTQTYVKVHYKLKHLNMTREQIKAQNSEKRQQRMREIAMAHEDIHKKFFKHNITKIKVSRRKEVDDPLDLTCADFLQNNVGSSIGTPMFDTFIQIQSSQDS